MKFAKLIMITENNNNKEYIMTQVDSSTFKVEYGRVGASYTTVSYPMSKWDSQYRSKTRKGYEDKTDLVEKTLIDDKGKGKTWPYDYITDSSVRDILNRLYRYTDSYLKENYLINATDVSQKQIDEAYNVIEDIQNMSKSNLDYKAINKKLLDLFKAVPRKMKNVKNELFDEYVGKSELKAKIKTELDMLKTMADAVELRNKRTKTTTVTDDKVLTEAEQAEKTLNDLGLIVENVTAEDIKVIKKALGSESAHLYKNAWKITNPNSEKRFNDLMETPNYKGKEVNLFWHGSRNQNWYNIIQTGLVTNPKGVKITGKMFGYGIYFASRARKSINYTSLDTGHSWNGDNQKNGFMALFEVAMGRVKDVHKHESWCYSTNKEMMNKHSNADTLYAHAGVSLQNDEIIAYDDDQVNIKYIVELSK